MRGRAIFTTLCLLLVVVMTSFLAVLSRLKNTLPEEPEMDSRSVFLLPFDKDLRVESEDETLPPFIINGPLLFISGLISVTLVS